MEGGTFALTATEAEPLPVTNQEEKELRRVFNLLSDYQRKLKVQAEVDALQELLAGSKNFLRGTQDMQIINLERFENNHEACHKRIDELAWELENLALNPQKKISVNDVMEMVKRLRGGKVPNKKDIEDMLWEVDEDLDQHINWPEFKLMFTRNILDTSGLEPSRMFYLTQFLIYDHNENGMVSVDETMNMLYARYGRATMEKKLKELFGDDMHETGREGGEISYDKFTNALHRVQMSTFWGTTKGKNLSNKGGLKKADGDD